MTYLLTFAVAGTIWWALLYRAAKRELRRNVRAQHRAREEYMPYREMPPCLDCERFRARNRVLVVRVFNWQSAAVVSWILIGVLAISGWAVIGDLKKKLAKEQTRPDVAYTIDAWQNIAKVEHSPSGESIRTIYTSANPYTVRTKNGGSCTIIERGEDWAHTIVDCVPPTKGVIHVIQHDGVRPVGP